MQIRTVEAGRGAGWLLDGFDYFKKDPVNWIVVTILLFVIAIVLRWFPLGLGEMAFQVIAPAFIAGLVLGCKAQDEGGKIEVRHLFAAFSSANISQIVLVGVLYFIGVFNIVIVAASGAFMFGVNLFAMAGASHAGDILQSGINLGLFLIPVLIALAASVPLLMAVWFAPALVVLGNLGAVDALKQSFAGCLANVVPFLVYGIVGLVLAIVASIPLGLGWLVLLPMITASLYIAYKEIFTAGAPATVA